MVVLTGMAAKAVAHRAAQQTRRRVLEEEEARAVAAAAELGALEGRTEAVLAASEVQAKVRRWSSLTECPLNARLDLSFFFSGQGAKGGRVRGCL
jgi:hypothetical protein